MTPFLAGLALGLASSAHCAAMCGPLVLTAGRAIAARSRAAHAAQLVLHHAVRILVYALLAVPAGLAGESLALRGFGRAIAIAAGVVLLAAALGSLRAPAFGRIGDALTAAVARASTPILRWSRRHPAAGPLLTGALHGVLPCGLVYGALTTAVAAGSVGGSMRLMAGFGIGTSAVLLAISNGAAAITPSLRLRLRPLTPLVLAVTAAILIARGVLPSHQHDAGAPAHHHMHE
jgi:uncharacterized protein